MAVEHLQMHACVSAGGSLETCVQQRARTAQYEPPRSSGKAVLTACRSSISLRRPWLAACPHRGASFHGGVAADEEGLCSAQQAEERWILQMLGPSGAKSSPPSCWRCRRGSEQRREC